MGYYITAQDHYNQEDGYDTLNSKLSTDEATRAVDKSRTDTLEPEWPISTRPGPDAPNHNMLCPEHPRPYQKRRQILGIYMIQAKHCFAPAFVDTTITENHILLYTDFETSSNCIL